MANVNIAQYEQLLKSLEHAFKEIGGLHQQIHNILDVMQINVHQACHDVNVSWSKVVNLFVTVDQLRLERLKFEKDEQQIIVEGDLL